MTARTIRRAERAAHLFWALVIVLSVYGWTPSWGEPLVRWVVVPGIAASGFAMWFAAPLRRLARGVLALVTSRLGDGTGPAEPSMARSRGNAGSGQVPRSSRTM